jgi:phosphoribosylanthranilate isomerase
MKVKICGIKTVHDALMASQLGADAIGLLVGKVHQSKDFISPDLAREIAKVCPLYVNPVLVTHIKDPKSIYELACYIGTTVIQVHSYCSIQDIRSLRGMFEHSSCSFNIKLIKGLHANSPVDQLFRDIELFQSEVDGLIIDTLDSDENRVGGTGKTHDWNISRRVVSATKCPVILAGGLGPANISTAIRHVMPYGVDANSCLQNIQGLKDEFKVAKFISKARLAFLEQSPLVHS